MVMKLRVPYKQGPAELPDCQLFKEDFTMEFCYAHILYGSKSIKELCITCEVGLSDVFFTA